MSDIFFRFFHCPRYFSLRSQFATSNSLFLFLSFEMPLSLHLLQAPEVVAVHHFHQSRHHRRRHGTAGHHGKLTDGHVLQHSIDDFDKFLHALTVSATELLCHVLLNYLIEHAACKTGLNLAQCRVGGEGTDAPLWRNRVPQNALKLLLWNRLYRTGIAVSGNVSVNSRIRLRTVNGNALGKADVPAGSADLDRVYTAVHQPIF